MKKTLHLSIECGEKTCASEPGVFCRFLHATHFGQQPVCGLFPSKDGSYTWLDDQEGGWVQRCADCLNAEKEEV